VAGGVELRGGEIIDELMQGGSAQEGGSREGGGQFLGGRDFGRLGEMGTNVNCLDDAADADAADADAWE